MQDSPSTYQLFSQISEDFCAAHPLPQYKPCRGQALWRNEGSLKVLLVGKEDRLLCMAPSGANRSAESSAAQGPCPSCPRYNCLSATGAAGSGLAWGGTFRFWFNYLLF